MITELAKHRNPIVHRSMSISLAALAVGEVHTMQFGVCVMYGVLIVCAQSWIPPCGTQAAASRIVRSTVRTLCKCGARLANLGNNELRIYELGDCTLNTFGPKEAIIDGRQSG